MRLIDADALKEKLTMVTKSYKPNAIMERPAILLEDVETAPTIDAVEVVRCKDCKHFDGSYPMCCRFEETIKADGYCSFGEKREVEE